MKFKVLSEEELADKMGNLSPGKSDFQIFEAEDKVSKAGNPMLALNLKVWDQNGREGRVFDYITANAQWKLKKMLEAVGMEKEYEQGEVDPNQLMGKSGQLTLVMTKDPERGDRLNVKNYLPHSIKKEAQSETILQQKSDTDLPNFDEDLSF